MSRFAITALAFLAAVATVAAQRLYVLGRFAVHILTTQAPPAPPRPLPRPVRPTKPAPASPPAEETVAGACARISQRLAQAQPLIPQDLSQLTRRQLQQLVGTRRNLPKRQLVELVRSQVVAVGASGDPGDDPYQAV